MACRIKSKLLNLVTVALHDGGRGAVVYLIGFISFSSSTPNHAGLLVLLVVFSVWNFLLDISCSSFRSYLDILKSDVGWCIYAALARCISTDLVLCNHLLPCLYPP